ncbi:hypothetical protein V3C33_10920 [Micrococcaceae bacterium Sec5.7]
MKIPHPLPEPLASAPFTLGEALDAGVSPGRLRKRRLLTPSRGIRMAADDGALQLAQLARPVSLITQFSAVSHATAFLLWDLPGFLPGSDAPGVHISRPDHMAIARRRGVIGHRGQFFPDEIEDLDGLLVTSRVRTWLDVSRRMSVDELTVAADHLLRIQHPGLDGRTQPYATAEQLTDMLDRHKGTPGIRKARLALEQARAGADSAPETRLRLALDRSGLPEPELNVATELSAAVVRQPDLAYPEFRVAVEYDGEGHSEAAQIVRDIAREEDFAAAGWTLVRVSKRHMANGARSAATKVRAALLNGGWTPR